MIKQLHSQAIVLPTQDNNGKYLNYDAILDIASKNFGGYTITEQQCGWYSEDEERLMIDEAIRLKVCSDDKEELSYFTKNVVKYLFNHAQQEAVFIYLNNKPVLIDDKEDLQHLLAFLLNH